MCLAIPGKILETFDRQGVRMARVQFGGITRETCLECVPEAEIGNFVLVHVGMALAIIDEAEAERTFELLKQIGQLDELDAPAPEPEPR